MLIPRERKRFIDMHGYLNEHHAYPAAKMFSSYALWAFVLLNNPFNKIELNFLQHMGKAPRES